MSKDLNIILTRHSQAVHNQLKIQIQSHQQVKYKYKKSPEYVAFKFNKQFIDREQINQGQIDRLRCEFDKNEIGLIIVSPLNRCIQTAKLLNFNRGVPIIVETLIASRINSAWSIGKSLKEKKTRYPQISFDYSQQTVHWAIDSLLNDQGGFADFYSKRQKEPQSHQDIIIQYLRQGQGQSYKSIIKRALKFKHKLLHTYIKMTQKKVLILSHNNFLKVLTAKIIDQKGKARSDLIFDHMQLVHISEGQLIDTQILAHTDYIEGKINQN